MSQQITRTAGGIEVLVIERGAAAGAAVADALAQGGLVPTVVRTDAEALRAIQAGGNRLIVLGLHGAAEDDWTLCRWVRTVTDVPVIALADPQASSEDEVRALMLGVDDYLVQPVSAASLGARAVALLRRYRSSSSDRDDRYQDARLLIDFRRCAVSVDGVHLTLTPKEFQLLAFLARGAGAVFTADEILERVWGNDSESFGSVKNYISRLRQKFREAADAEELIDTVRGFGYRYNAHPARLPAAPHAEGSPVR